ncbi:hypothetical protein DSL72_007405 [Monilinia vaccinii-corymbosi]|uniref:2EXR domain-containing protein n=1 Tax=Monilinia vaccinii-corymbosi TaxID=61207 RepID=A0A8A3PMX8_9HELO|nr:hypothetical protein DSL72_007405 [Monilinia vaccinii-corymbosi]
MKTTTTPSTFHLFSTLTPELRNRIWKEALPSAFRPSLYFYKKGCWQPRTSTKSHPGPGYCDEASDVCSSTDPNRNFEFRHELLDDIRVDTPLLSVNHEARNTALAWARTHGLKIYGETASPFLARSFSPNLDVLYVPHDRWNEFYNEPFDRFFEEDMLGQNHGTWNEVTRVAVPEALFSEDINSLVELYMYFSIQVVYIIVDVPPDLRRVHNPLDVQARWGCEDYPAGCFIWNDGKKKFEVKGEKEDWDKSLHDLIVEVSRELAYEVAEGRSSISEIRPVFAV